jgi:hypothetical protein
MSGRRRKILLALANLALFCALLEACSAAALVLFETLKPGNVVDLFVDRHFRRVDDGYRRLFLERAHHPVLGWGKRSTEHGFAATNTAGQEWSASYDERGARDDALPPLPLLAASYGDSFTYCSEVNDDQTWQHYLARSLGGEILNFGERGYGTGQAVLRSREHLAEGLVAPLTILGLYEGNVERTVNQFRAFYKADTGIKLGFKPAFRLGPSDEVRILPNPYRDPGLSLEELRVIAHDVARSDYWAVRKARLDFPFTWNLVRLSMFHLDEFRGRSGAGHWRSDREPYRVMDRIVELFIQTTREAGSAPFVLFLPSRNTMRAGLPPRYARFRDELRARHPELPVVDVREADFDHSRFNLRPFEGHASPYGNQVIARVLEERIRALPGVEARVSSEGNEGG